MDIDMSATRQQMLETAEHLNQQMTDGIPFTWETLEQALTSVTEQEGNPRMDLLFCCLLSTDNRESGGLPALSG